MKRTVYLSIVGLFLFSLGLCWLVWSNFVNQPASESSEEIVYEIPPGVTLRTAIRDLQSRGLIRNGDLFLILAKIRGLSNKMKVGEYLINKNMRPSEVLAVITSGKSLERKITISEGLNIFEIADIFAGLGIATREEFLKTATDRAFIKALTHEDLQSLEGYLFPETYGFTKYMEMKDIIAEMHRKFQATYKEVETQSKITGLTKHQIITLASIVEKETGAPQERPLISSVFHNRMKKGMKLQTDPTVIYGKMLSTRKSVNNITKADLLEKTPYNTYVINGLPPGPIANPGRDALLAAVQPENSEYLFFVSHNDGTHEFTKDFKNHRKAVMQFQLDRTAREGKSWRDLKIKKTN
jgi:UPF0755 protein